ncbi:protein PerC (Protein bfpW) [Escherichia coli TA008]|nr:protein PerC (Protein bfpW) [Escherichia coli TA008]
MATGCQKVAGCDDYSSGRQAQRTCGNESKGMYQEGKAPDT